MHWAYYIVIVYGVFVIDSHLPQSVHGLEIWNTQYHPNTLYSDHSLDNCMGCLGLVSCILYQHYAHQDSSLQKFQSCHPELHL